MIKKLIFVLAVAACSASCFKDGNKYSSTYYMDMTFEYQNAFGGVKDSLFYDRQYAVGIGWDHMAFYHKLDEDKTTFLGGFMLSRLTGSGDSDQNRFRVNSGAGFKSSAYMVYYANPDESLMPEKDIEFVISEYGKCTMFGCYLNNTKEVVMAVREKFEDGDKLSVKMTGYLDGMMTSSQEFVLAEFTEAKDSLVTDWSVFMLDKLGEVDVVDVEIVSTRNDMPKAFCMDSMLAKVEIAY